MLTLFYDGKVKRPAARIDTNIVGWKDWATGQTVVVGPGKKFVPY
ncbi:MAG: hypothetical protein QMB24_01605 [Spirosomataceae bacterium]